METVELEKLVGLHELSGVDITNKSIKAEYGDYYEDCQCISFILDGVTYTAIENPEDGYRSSMREIGISEAGITNTFPPVKVMGKMKGNDNYEENDVLEFLNTKTGKVILEVGTGNTNDYYPYFVANFMPEEMVSPLSEKEE